MESVTTQSKTRDPHFLASILEDAIRADQVYEVTLHVVSTSDVRKELHIESVITAYDETLEFCANIAEAIEAVYHSTPYVKKNLQVVKLRVLDEYGAMLTFVAF